MHLTLLCGLSFAGKSTLAAGLALELDALLVDLDAINAERGLRGGQGIPISEWVRTNELAHERASAALQHGQRVVVDDTGSPRFIRDDWRAVAANTDAAFVLVWVQIDAGLQRQRILANRSNQSRQDVIDRVLEEQRASFEQPSEDESAIVVNARDTADPETAKLISARILGGI